MSFLNPGLFAAGLACVALPIIIHLLMHRRRKPVVWGAMRFLLEAYRRQQRRLRLEKWLLLLTRCLLVAMLALGLGKPLLGGLLESSSAKTLFILIDNSAASGLRDGPSAALDRHKKQARELIASLRDSRSGAEAHRVGIVALGGPAEALVLPPTSDLSAAGALIDAIEPADSRADIPGALSLVGAALQAPPDATPTSTAAPIASDRTYVALLSEFREGSLELVGPDAARPPRLPEGVRLIVADPSRAPARNVSIVAAEPLRSILLTGAPDSGADLVRVTLQASGEAGSTPRPTSIWAGFAREGDTVAPPPVKDHANVTWRPGEDTTIAVVPLRVEAPRPGETGSPRTSGILVVGIDDDALPADNRFRRPIESRPALRVGIVAPTRFGAFEAADKLDAASWLRLALAPGSEPMGIETVDIEPASLDAPRLAGLDALALPRPDLIPESGWPRIRAFLDSSTLVLVMPPAGLSVHTWPDVLSRSLGLEFTLSREPLILAAEQRPARGPARDDPLSRLLSLIDGELDDLLSPVSVRKLLPMQPAPDHGAALLTLDPQTPLLWIGAPGTPTGAAEARRGLIAYLAIAPDLEWSNLPAKPVMVPLVQELVRQGVGRARGALIATAGERPTLPARTAELRALEDPAFASAGPRAFSARVGPSGVIDPLRRAGVLRALDVAGTPRALVAVNADPRGTRVGVQSRQAVGSWLERALFGESGPTAAAQPDRILWLGPGADQGGPAPAQSITPSGAFAGSAKATAGSPFWWPALVAALVLAVLELLLARLASHATLTSPAIAPGRIPSPVNSPGDTP